MSNSKAFLTMTAGLALIEALQAKGIEAEPIDRPAKPKANRMPHQGKQEIERRRRQMERDARKQSSRGTGATDGE